MSDKKSIIKEQHDPLSWLLQDEDSTGMEAADKNEILAEKVEIEPTLEAGDNQINEAALNDNLDKIIDSGNVNERSDKNIILAVEPDRENSGAKEIDDEELTMQSTDAEKNNDNQEAAACPETVSVQDDIETLVLDEDMSIIHVGQLKESWLPLVDGFKNIRIDARKVEDIDTAGLQLLLSFVKTIKAKERKIIWQEPSAALLGAVTETALKEVMGI